MYAELSHPFVQFLPSGYCSGIHGTNRKGVWSVAAHLPFKVMDTETACKEEDHKQKESDVQ